MAKNWNHFSYPPLRAMVNLPQHFEEMGNLIERIKM
jgi:hypothetical protein